MNDCDLERKYSETPVRFEPGTTWWEWSTLPMVYTEPDLTEGMFYIYFGLCFWSKIADELTCSKSIQSLDPTDFVQKKKPQNKTKQKKQFSDLLFIGTASGITDHFCVIFYSSNVIYTDRKNGHLCLCPPQWWTWCSISRRQGFPRFCQEGHMWWDEHLCGCRSFRPIKIIIIVVIIVIIWLIYTYYIKYNIITYYRICPCIIHNFFGQNEHIKWGVLIIHGCVLYTGKYGNQKCLF